MSRIPRDYSCSPHGRSPQSSWRLRSWLQSLLWGMWTSLLSLCNSPLNP